MEFAVSSFPQQAVAGFRIRFLDDLIHTLHKARRLFLLLLHLHRIEPFGIPTRAWCIPEDLYMCSLVGQGLEGGARHDAGCMVNHQLLLKLGKNIHQADIGAAC